ncbi:ABC-F family ATP-binding cassette domain-containing protein [Corynebacterium sp. sy017]|nr:ABC-F family ATP-binding cassette domain-containing protein [Corynebacterium sp. sy017]TSD91778.1 ABC-F family ATP-binding cassette domain-containing protein [Corynebacterium sp. SY003]
MDASLAALRTLRALMPSLKARVYAESMIRSRCFLTVSSMFTSLRYYSNGTVYYMAKGVTLACESVSYRVGERTLFQELSMTLGWGAKLGVIGENGAGKSTLLSLLAGEISPTSGLVDSSSKPAFVPQEKDLLRGDSLVSDEIAACLEPLYEIEEELNQASRELVAGDSGSLEKYSNALQRAEIQDVWSAPQRIERYLYGLGLESLSRRQRVDELSAGERRRLAMALTMVSRPEILLLDEPSNYLDEQSRIFLQDEIKNWEGIVIFVSHDREFLEKVPTGICDLDKSFSSQYLYRGAYRDYLKQKDDEINRWKERYANEQEEIRRLKHTVAVKAHQINHHRAMSDNNKKAYGARGDRVQSQISRRVRAARERLNQINRSSIPEPPQSLVMSIAPTKTPVPSSALLAQLRSVKVNKRSKRAITLDIASDDKIIVTGPNGSGKTTLLEIISGKLKPTQGSILKGNEVSIGYLGHEDLYCQDKRTAREIYDSSTPDAAPRLTSLGLLENVDMAACELSVGQRKRLELGILLQGDHDILLLDEPTNHLSLRLCEELIELLSTWPASVIIASHDPWVRSQHGWRIFSVVESAF